MPHLDLPIPELAASGTSRRVRSSFWSALSLRRSSHLWRLSRGPWSRQSTEAFRSISFFQGCSVRGSHLEIWCLVSFWSCLWLSCSLCLGVACGVQAGIFREVLVCHSCAILGSGEVDSDPEVVFLRFHAEWRSVLRRCFSFHPCCSQLALGIWTVFL